MRNAALIVVACALAASGCGGSSAEEKQQAAAQAAAHKRAVKQAKMKRERQAAYEQCTATLTDLQDALTELDSRLSVGLNYENYGTKVADASVAYDRTDMSALTENPDCLTGVGIYLERALNQYIKADATWDGCFDDIYCDMEDVQPDMQVRWGKATRALERADVALATLEP